MRQQYIEVPWQTALAEGCNIVQPKYDGIWAEIKCTAGSCTLRSRTGTIKDEFELNTQDSFTLIGEYMFGSEWAQDASRKGLIYAFDCLSINDDDFHERPYSERFGACLQICELFPARFKPVPCYPATETEQVWKMFVEQSDYEGITLRKLNDLWSAPVYKAKRVVQKPYHIVAFHEGDKRLTKTLGAFGVSPQPSGPELFRVGGGFTDQERDFIWHNQQSLYNASVLVEGRKEFESGKLRHPNFVKFL